MPFSEETVGGYLSYDCYSHEEEAIMRKVKLIVHETYQGKRKTEDVFAAVFLSNAAALTAKEKPSIIELTDRSQDSLCSRSRRTEYAELRRRRKRKRMGQP